MSKSQNFLWNRILEVNKELKSIDDALAKWEKQLLLQVLVKQLKDEMGEEAFQNFVESSRKLAHTA